MNIEKAKRDRVEVAELKATVRYLNIAVILLSFILWGIFVKIPNPSLIMKWLLFVNNGFSLIFLVIFLANSIQPPFEQIHYKLALAIYKNQQSKKDEL